MIISGDSIVIAFILSLIAGLSTGLGGCIALFVKNTNTKFLSISLGFSSGVMIYVSMTEIFREANEFLCLSFGAKTGGLYTIIGFFGGMLLTGVINRIIPENVDNYRFIDKKNNDWKTKARLLRTGLFTAVIIFVHNFPEGIASFISSLHSLTFAIPIVIAISLHNIPEGISVSVPIYYATNSKEKAFFYSLLSGMAEPLGALAGYFLLLPFMSNTVFGILYAIIAGIMVFISLDELLPAAREYGEHNLSIYGLFFGMLFMAFSLWLFI